MSLLIWRSTKTLGKKHATRRKQMLCCAKMGLDVTTEEFSAQTVAATKHNHATERMVQLNK